ncbi:MMPL family transporter [Demequina zhanjiangensis]|uniref:MMPL family transporter n=1 Tax=Demequina zhanjiangensis TaxID=3051659 RepID=A0ABT8G1T7_9MICO|nr:MMPL family transporter [Demequina sp. SYSU T00b26]MDN4472899.1 MMPL family transporter [Demequina sp. SYSU T00b26]
MSRFARWTARHRIAVVVAWVLLLFGLGGAAGAAGAAFSDVPDMPDSESARAIEMLSTVDGVGGTTGHIVWQADGSSIDDPAVVSQVDAMLDRVAGLEGVTSVVSPYDDPSGAQISAETDTAFATVAVTDGFDMEQVRDVIEASETDTLQIEMGGTALTADPGGQHGAEVIGLIAALILLYAMFRAKRAALLPLLTGVVGVVASILVVVLGAHLFDISEDAITMGALIGLGVGIDYSLFLTHRFRKALASGRSVEDSIAEAVDTSGRSVVFAGITVMIALVGMFLLGMAILTAMAISAAVTVLFTVLAAITLLPALLAMLGTKALSRRQRAELAESGVASMGQPRFATRWVTTVQRAPRRAAVAALLLVGIVAAPLTQMHISRADASADSVGTPTRDYYDLMTPAFGAGIDAQVVVVADITGGGAADAFDQLVAELPALDDVASVQAAPAGMLGDVAIAAVTPTTSAQMQETEDLVNEIRDVLAPEAAAAADIDVLVTGTTAANMDIAEGLLGNLPTYLLAISVLGFLLLAVAFRSFMVPLLGVLTNLLSIGVGIGAAVAVFQFGWGSSIFGVGGGAPIIYMVPVLVAGVVFGLAMDYQVFLVSRMHEEWTRTGDHRRAVRVGGSDTAKVIAAAALIMVSVFASFAFSGDRIVSAIGVALGVAVLLDAFAVRLTLMPALMTLIGERTWSYPGWAERISPHVSVEGAAHDDADEADLEPALVGARQR